MLKYLLAPVVVVATVRDAAAQETPSPTRVEVTNVRGILTLISLRHEPRPNASHTFVLSHGLCGIDERFFHLGDALFAHDAKANVLVVDWSPGADKRIRGVPNPLAVADRIEPTGDVLGLALARLKKAGCIDPAKTTFIGESFGNCVNHRATVNFGKAQRALILNPPCEFGGYCPPSFKARFKQSIVCSTDSCLDTREGIANKWIPLRPKSNGVVEQHTSGMGWLMESLATGRTMDAVFQRR